MTTTTTCTKKPNITEISPHLICALCGGYLIDATTIVECLHSFCKTCIVRYLEASKYCPICEVLVHKTRPLQNIKLDHTLQDIVYKLVPGLFKDEMRRRREFYKESPTIRSAKTRMEQQRHRIIYSAEEKFSVSLEFCPDGKVRSRSTKRSKSSQKEAPDRRYLLCPAGTTVSLLKKFMKMKFALPERFKVDVFHRDGNLRDHYSLMDVAYIYSWKREGVLQLYYSVFKLPEPVPQIEVKVTEVEEVKVEVKDEPTRPDDMRPSSLFAKDSLLSSRDADGNLTHNLSPLELIATVAIDRSCYQEGRGLKRKVEESQLYENDEDSSSEIQIKKSIEHAIDLCSNGNVGSNIETAKSQQEANNVDAKSDKQTVLLAIEKEQSGSTPVVCNNKVSLSTRDDVTGKSKPREKPRTAETASQCDAKVKKHKLEHVQGGATVLHSRPPVKSVKTVKDDHSSEVKQKEDGNSKTDKSDKVKNFVNNNNTKMVGQVVDPAVKQPLPPAPQDTPVIPVHQSKLSNNDSSGAPISTNQKPALVKTMSDVIKGPVSDSNVTLTNGHSSPDIEKQQTVSGKS